MRVLALELVCRQLGEDNLSRARRIVDLLSQGRYFVPKRGKTDCNVDKKGQDTSQWVLRGREDIDVP